MKATRHKENLRENKLFYIESYGVQIEFELGEGVDWSMIKDRLKLALPNGFEEIKGATAIRRLSVAKNADATYSCGEDGKEIIGRVPAAVMFEQLDRRIRLTVAEFAVEKVFLHAGVVVWNGRGIVIPAKSFQGKTTLVAELVKRGAVYYSDEYAVLDSDGWVHPFPKMLSMRGIIDDFQQVDVPVESFGGVAGSGGVPVGLVIFTRFQANARWLPRKVSPGRAIIEIIQHTLPIRNKPEFVLKVLNNMLDRAIITKTKRGDAAQAAELLIGFFEKHTKLT